MGKLNNNMYRLLDILYSIFIKYKKNIYIFYYFTIMLLLHNNYAKFIPQT